MNKLKIVSLLTLLVISINSYSQEWEWAKSYGTNNGDQASSLALDPSGNSFISGYYQGTQLILGSTTLNTTFSNNLFLAKHNSAGTVVWSQSIGSNGSLNLGSVCTGTNGNVYVCGTFSGPTLMFGTATVSLTPGTISNWFVGCFSSTGSTLWINKYGTSASPYGVSARSCYYSSADNSVYVGGSFTGTLTIGSTNLINSTTNNDIFLTKLSVAPFSATPTWAIKAGSATSGDIAQKVAVDRQSNVYFSGTFAPVTGSTTTIGATLTSKGGQDLYVAKYNSSGAFQWSQSFGSTGGSDFLYDMVLDTASNVYLAGSYNTNPLLFNTLFGTYTLTTIGGSDAFVAKWGSIGLFSTAIKIGTATGNEVAYGLGRDYKGNIYVGGTYSTPTLAIGSTTLTNSAGGINAFVTRLFPSLGFSWSRDSKGSGSAMIWDLEADANDNVYSCGTIQVSAPSSFATTTLTSVGGSDIHIEKIGCTTPTITASNSNQNTCANTANSLSPYINTPQSDVTYSWSVVGASGVIISPVTGTTTTITYTGTTSFSIVVTGTNACSNVTTTVGSVTVIPNPTVTATASQSIICHQGSITFSASGASIYDWIPSSITNGTPQTFYNWGGTPGTQTVSVRGWDSGHMCKDSAVVLTFTVMPTPTITVTGTSLTCSGATNILTGHGGSTYTWTPGSIVSPTYAANASSPTVYSVSAHDAYGCLGDTTFTYSFVSPQTPSICEVTVDSLSQYNHIIWNKASYTNVDSFIVYREVQTNVYRRIGAQDKNALSLFIDTARSVGPANGDPNISYYKYKLQLRDTCGNYSALSLYHTSVYFITISSGTYIWNSYVVEPSTYPVTTYDLIRDNNATGTWTVVGSTTGTTINDPAAASYTNAIYRVEANGFNCNPTAKTTQQVVKSKSNVKNNFNVGVHTSIVKNELSSGISIAPNPASSQLLISFNTPISSTTKISVTDVLGKVVYNSEMLEGNSMSIPVNELSNGIYFVKIEQGKNYTVKKFIKE